MKFNLDYEINPRKVGPFNRIVLDVYIPVGDKKVLAWEGITPEGFLEILEEVAREALIELIS